ncbi:MAG: VOC family protein, partial [Paraglaciecola chathamensis]
MSELFVKHVALDIPTEDKAKAISFYTDFGLNIKTPTANQIEANCTDIPYPSIVLRTGAAFKRLNHIQMGASEVAFQKIQKQLTLSGVALLTPPSGYTKKGLWFREPNGILFNVLKCDDHYQVKPVPPFLINTPGHINRVNQGAQPPKSTLPDACPLKMGHVLLFTPDVESSLAFLETILDMRLSDRSGSGIVFTHSQGGSEHHVIAFAKSSHIGFHHASFLVGSPDEVGLGGTRMIEKGHNKSWGFGRHAIGSNFFHYVADPWGSYAEYYSDMDYIIN